MKIDGTSIPTHFMSVEDSQLRHTRKILTIFLGICLVSMEMIFKNLRTTHCWTNNDVILGFVHIRFVFGRFWIKKCWWWTWWIHWLSYCSNVYLCIWFIRCSSLFWNRFTSGMFSFLRHFLVKKSMFVVCLDRDHSNSRGDYRGYCIRCDSDCRSKYCTIEQWSRHLWKIFNYLLINSSGCYSDIFSFGMHWRFDFCGKFQNLLIYLQWIYWLFFPDHHHQIIF